MFAGLALVVPPQPKQKPPTWFGGSIHASGPRVTTTIRSVEAIPPARAYDGIIEEAAERYQVDPALLRSVMSAESAFDPSAVSRAGAMGLMQLMPDIADAFGVEHPFDPRENIMAGARLLRELLDQYNGDLSLALAGYNAGATAVADWGGVVPPFRETEGYVKRVTNLLADARRGNGN